MARLSPCLIRVFICITLGIAAIGSSLYAQTEPTQTDQAQASPPPASKTITIRMLDSKTGHLILTNEFLVQINHQEEMHANWVQVNQDGAGVMTVPPNATVIDIHAKYDDAMSIYINCDTQLDKGSSDHAPALDRWYAISDILTSGVVAPNGCGSMKVVTKLTATAKPGEFVFFVRKANWRERAVE